MIDTLKAYNNLRDHGVDEDQAEAIVYLIYDASRGQLDHELTHARLVGAGFTERQAEGLIEVTVDVYAGKYGLDCNGTLG